MDKTAEYECRIFQTVLPSSCIWWVKQATISAYEAVISSGYTWWIEPTPSDEIDSGNHQWKSITRRVPIMLHQQTKFFSGYIRSSAYCTRADITAYCIDALLYVGGKDRRFG